MMSSRMHTLAVGCLVVLVACAAEVPADEGGNRVGSYPTVNGGTLDIYEPIPGDFVVGERLIDGDGELEGREGDADGAESADRANETLTGLYQRLVGGEVPPEVLRAEERRVRLEAELALAGEQAPAERVEPMAQIPAIEQGSAEFEAKEVDRGVANFQIYHCRGLDTTPQKNFNICLTERTGDATIGKNDAHGNYSAVRVYRGTLDYSVRYNLTGWETAFNVTVYEGQTYRARKVGPVRDYDIEARTRNASGDGYNLALIGTTNRGEKTCYNDFGGIACVYISGSPL